MCLAKIDKVTKRGRGYGYKAFNITIGRLYPVAASLPAGVSFPEEQWFTDPKQGMVDGLNYPAGFNIHTNKKHVLGWNGDTNRKVYYKEVVASGLFSVIVPEHVIIARQIYITKEEI